MNQPLPVNRPRYGHGLVLGKFYPLHAGHSALIRTAVQTCERVTVQLLATHAETIPLEMRKHWLTTEHPDVHVVADWDDLPVDFDDPVIWDGHMKVIESLLDSPVDAVFTSDDYGAELARRLRAQWVQVDPGRVRTPVSGTAVRADPARYWWALAPAVRQWYATRIVVLGAESTGTTTLAEALAEHLGAPWVPEYGRAYTEERPGGLDAPWRSEEFLTVAHRQRELEDEAIAASSSPLIVCDTDVLATGVWHERYVGHTLPALTTAAAAHVPWCYVLTCDDIPFVQDGMRDGEHLRPWMTQRFREVLAEQPAPWVEVRGSVEERLAATLEFTELLLDPGRPVRR